MAEGRSYVAAQHRAQVSGVSELQALMEVFIEQLETVDIPGPLLGDFEAAKGHWLGGRRQDIETNDLHVFEYIRGRGGEDDGRHSGPEARALWCLFPNDSTAEELPEVAYFFDDMISLARRRQPVPPAGCLFGMLLCVVLR